MTKTIEQVVDEILTNHTQQGGSTVTPFVNPITGYVVAINSHKATHTGQFLPRAEVTRFVLAHWPEVMINNGFLAYGTWYDEDTNESMIEMSMIFADLDSALHHGKIEHQKAIFDLSSGEVIYLEGQVETSDEIAKGSAFHFGNGPIEPIMVLTGGDHTLGDLD